MICIHCGRDPNKPDTPVNIEPLLKALADACLIDLAVCNEFMARDFTSAITRLEHANLGVSHEDLAKEVLAFGRWFESERKRHPNPADVPNNWRRWKERKPKNGSQVGGHREGNLTSFVAVHKEPWHEKFDIAIRDLWRACKDKELHEKIYALIDEVEAGLPQHETQLRFKELQKHKSE